MSKTIKSIFSKKGNVIYSLLKMVVIPVFGIAMGYMLEAGTAQADSLNVNNAGFETPFINGGPGNFATDDPRFGTTANPTITNIPGWDFYNPQNSTSVGFAILNPNRATLPNGTTEGNNALSLFPFLDANYQADNSLVGKVSFGASQTLTDTLTANTTYTLSVDVLNPQDTTSPSFGLTGFAGYDVQLLADGNVIAEDNNSLTVPEPGFITSTVSYTATANSPSLGKNLGIRLIDLNNALGRDVDFDNVRLTATAVPAPSPMLGILLATGMGYIMKRRLKVKKLVKIE